MCGQLRDVLLDNRKRLFCGRAIKTASSSSYNVAADSQSFTRVASVVQHILLRIFGTFSCRLNFSIGGRDDLSTFSNVAAPERVGHSGHGIVDI